MEGRERTHLKIHLKPNKLSRDVVLLNQPEPKYGHLWQSGPQALPTRLQQQICLVMLLRIGREQEDGPRPEPRTR